LDAVDGGEGRALLSRRNGNENTLLSTRS
jgi:hypothetical protein